MDKAIERICKVELDFERELTSIYQKMKAIDSQYSASCSKLYQRRQEIISGKGTPTAEELRGYLATGDSTTALTGHKGVPYFWLNALHNQDTLAESVNSRDKLALAYCTSVKVVHSNDAPPTLEMSFSSNPFFSNNTLRRCLGDEKLGVIPVTTDIRWKDTAHNLTVKEVKKGGAKKSKKAGKGKTAEDAEAGSSSARLRPCTSFFRFFLPDSDSSSGRDSKAPKHLHDPTALDEQEAEGDKQQSAKDEQDELIMRLITQEVLPRAAELYLAGPLQSLDSDEDGEGDGYQLVHGAAGLDPSELPGPVQALLAALRFNQAQINALQEERAQLRNSVQQQEVQLRKQLGQQRRELLIPPGSNSSYVPRFWLRVLRSADAAALAVSPRDAAVLAHLADVRYTLAAETGSSSSSNKELHGRFELEFLPNPYLSPSTLTLVKEYSFEITASGDPYLLHSRTTTAPVWSSVESDPTHKKGRDGKQRPASSLFQVFKQGGGKYAFNLSGSERDVQDEANELETELLLELHGLLLPKAGTIYSQLAQDGWPDDDSAEGDKAAWQREGADAESEDTDDEGPADDDDDDDEGEAAHKAAMRRAKHKQQGWRVTKASVLIGMIVLMLLAEVFVFMDMTGLFRGMKR